MADQATLRPNYSEGGAGLGSSSIGNKNAKLATVLRAAQRDLEGGRPALITTADADATFGQPEADLVNEIKAALNRISDTLAAAVLPAGAAETYNLASGPVLTVEVNGVNRAFTFADTDFATPSAATAAEAAAALNSRAGIRNFGVIASDNSGTLELTSELLGGDQTLLGIAGGANTVLLFDEATAVTGTGHRLNLSRSDT